VVVKDKHSRALGWIGAVAVVATLAAACGGSRGSSSSGTTAAPAATAAPGTTAAGGGTSAASTSTTAAGEKFGTLDSPCGKGDAKGATDQGVTDTSISIGYGDDAGFAASPGLNHQISDAMKATIKWCNEQGGINGRQITGNYYDAKITEVNNVMIAACQKEFMLVGEGWALDGSQEQTRLGCKLPAVPTYSVSAEFANAPLMYQAVPNPIDVTPGEMYAQIAKAFPDKIAKTAVMFANYSATIDTKDKAVQVMQHFGYTILPCPQQYNIAGEADWKPFIQKLKDCGAQIVYFTGSPYPNFENVLDAAAQLNFKPMWLTDANFYDTQLAAYNTSGNADNVYVREAYVPLEAAASNPATKKYLDIVKASGGDVNQLGEQASSSFLLWATAARSCGSTLTRDCVMSYLSKVTKWDGGGMHASGNSGQNLPPDCGLILKLQGTKYVQYFPATAGQYDCSPDYLVKITGPVVDQAQLGPDRVSTKYKAS
jgi:ABC-type branched-subunit amino acid transport system substrate-binding protein